MVIGDTLRKAVKLFPRKEAVICGDKRWTYAEFDRRVRGLAYHLMKRGVKKGERVAILHNNCHYFLESYYACALLGIVSVPINVRLAAEEIVRIVEDAGARMVISAHRYRELLSAIQGKLKIPLSVIWTGVNKEDLSPGVEGPFYEEVIEEGLWMDEGSGVLEDDLAHLYYTSGTTGSPKGVMLTHKNVMVHAVGTIAELQLTDRDVWLHGAPLFHLADAWATWAITWVGGRHVLVGDFLPSRVLSLIEQERVTLTNLIPTMLNMLINDEQVHQHDYSSLRLLLSGGAPIAPALVKRLVETFRCDYVQTYGMTETSPYLTLSLLKGHLLAGTFEEQLRYKAKTGREFIGVELKVINERGEEVAKDEKEVGEIIVRGDTVTPGYWNLPDETEKVLKDGWLYTGDMAVIDEEGYVTIVDRKKDIIITGGENVYSTEVENVLYLHPAVLECAVIGVPDEKWGEAVKALVVLKPGFAVDEGELIAFCKERIARYKAPKSVDFLPALPKTGTGKIEKQKLREKYRRDRGLADGSTI